MLYLAAADNGLAAIEANFLSSRLMSQSGSSDRAYDVHFKLSVATRFVLLRGEFSIHRALLITGRSRNES
jgi:hypothetical protein